uniref:Uncharacterized protein n=1 Tax=Arundo donax TaxID=35708 RepID=A0A0A9CNS3_ARUDO
MFNVFWKGLPYSPEGLRLSGWPPELLLVHITG